MAEIIDLSQYGTDFSSVITQGGIPIGDISILADPNRRTDRSKGFSVSGSDIARLSPDAPRTVVYGRTRVGGDVSFITTDQGEAGQFIHTMISLAGHEIDAIEKLYLDDREVIFGGGGAFADPRWGLVNTIWQDKVFMGWNLGSDDQPAQSDLVSQSAALFPGLWTTAHRQRGVAGGYLILVYEKSLFPNSVPRVQFLIRGKKVYDPRSDTTYWTDNAALCTADYIANTRYGCKATYAKIDIPQLIVAADACDELINLNGGGTEKQFTVNGVFDTSRSRRGVLQSLQACMGGGPLSRVGGKWYISPAKYTAPALTLTDDDLRSAMRIQVLNSRRDTPNGVKGTFTSPDNGYQVVDFPAQKNAFYLSQDGGIEKYFDVAYEFVTSNATAQRLAKIVLEESRQPIVVEALWAMRAYQVLPGDVVNLHFDRYGWAPKEFKVIKCTPSVDTAGAAAISLVLRETSASIYDWNDGEETLVDLAPNTYLPNPTVVQPLVFASEPQSGTDQLLLNGDGTVITRVQLDWEPSTDPFAEEIQVEYKKTSESDWQRNPTLSATSTRAFVVSVQDGIEYDFRIRQVNGSGFVSDWTVHLAHEVIGKSEPPSNVLNFTAGLQSFDIILQWSQIPDVDRDHYELRWGGTDWESSEVIDDDVRATSYRLKAAATGTVKFFIKAFDTSDNESFNPTAYELVIPGPSTPSVMSAVSGANIVFNWTDVTSQFAVDHYEISYGSSYGSSTLLASPRSTTHSLVPDWTGTRKFYFVSVDIASNKSLPFELNVNVDTPGIPQNLNEQVIDNNVLLRWSPPIYGTLPVSRYKIFRGDDINTADEIGDVNGTFFSIQEAAGGAYTYLVQPLDSSLNAGLHSSITVTLRAPNDYELLDSFELETFDTLSNVYDDPGGFFLGPVNTTETFQEHFDDNSFVTIQDQIDAGYPVYAQPGLLTGYIEQEIDLGAELSSGMIHALWNQSTIDGIVSIDPTISFSDDGMSWTDISAADVLASDFRYIKLRLDWNATDETGIAMVSNVRLKVDVKIDTDQGRITANSGDSGGTTVTFNKEFADIKSITVSANSTTDVKAIYDFTDVPNPTSMKVLVFDTAGSRVTREVSWNVRGVVK